MIHVTLSDLGALMGGASAVYCSIRGIPLLADRVRILRERDMAIESAAQSKEAAESYQRATEAYKTELSQVKDELGGLREEMAAAREEARQTQDDLRKTRELLAQSVVYITNLHTFMRLGGNMPQMPTELRNEIDAILEAKDAHEKTDHPPLK